MTDTTSKEPEPYLLLGLDQGASQAQVRAQFRKLAKQYHPDLHRQDPGKLAHYKKLTQAHELLSNPDKRAAYDEGLIGFSGRPSDPKLDEDALQFSAKRKHLFDLKGANLHFQMQIDFQTAHLGGRKKVKRKNGQKFDIVIPKGTRSGDVVRLFGQGGGDGILPNPGDALVEFIVKQDDIFSLHGNDIVMEVPISLSEAAFGTKNLRVNTLDGELKVTIPAQSNTDQKLRICGKGAWIGDKRRGDLYLRLLITLPDKWDPKLLTWLKDQKTKKRRFWFF